MNSEPVFTKETMSHAVMNYQLDLLRDNLALRTYPGYPANGDRLIVDPADLSRNTEGALVLPDGPWVINNHPRQANPQYAPDRETRQQLRETGLQTDAAGRPLHPWFTSMLTDPSIGVVLGKGAYWHWGPNYTADSIVICQEHVLLVKRKDTGLWALPGGHVDPGETALAAAPREVAEETGVIIPNGAKSTVTYTGPVVDLRVTAHAWPETTAVLYHLDQELPTAHGMDDAAEAAWVPLSVIEQESILFGSHRFLLRQAIT